jgi:hypothetical protein
MMKLIRFLVVSFYLFSVTTVFAENADSGGLRLLPNKDLFAPLVADPREAQFSARFERYNKEFEGELESFNASVVSFGDYLPVFDYEFENGNIFQFSVDGVMYALFNLDTPSWDLINTDYIFGFNAAWRFSDNWTTRLRLFHVSSHLGDEFVLDNPDVERKNSSYEDLELLLAYSPGNWRLYGGGAYVVRSNSLVNLDPWRARAGIEYRYPLDCPDVDLLFAAHFDAKERTNWRLARSLMAGVVFLKSEAREVRFMTNYYRGNSVQGQFFEETLEYFGFGFYFIV